MSTWIWIVKRYHNGQLDDISPYYFTTYEYANEYMDMVRDKEHKSYSYKIVEIAKADRWKKHKVSREDFIDYLTKKIEDD